jgi:hypothetical protein
MAAAAACGGTFEPGASARRLIGVGVVRLTWVDVALGISRRALARGLAALTFEPGASAPRLMGVGVVGGRLMGVA